MKIFRFSSAIAIALVSQLAVADVVNWTVQPASIMARATTTLSKAIRVGTTTPTQPNPRGSEWKPCKSGWVYFNQNAAGKQFEEADVDHMMSIALGAFKMRTKLRLAIRRDAEGHCYTSQVIDTGSSW